MHFLLLLFASYISSGIGSAIHAAVDADDATAVNTAIQGGADLNEIGPGGQTPLMHAVLQGQLKAVKALLAAGADTTIGEKDGYTPMHGAGFQGRDRIAKRLIKAGLDPSDMHADGYTPLHRACWGREKRHTDMVCPEHDQWT